MQEAAPPVGLTAILVGSSSVLLEHVVSTWLRQCQGIVITFTRIAHNVLTHSHCEWRILQIILAGVHVFVPHESTTTAGVEAEEDVVKHTWFIPAPEIRSLWVMLPVPVMYTYGAACLRFKATSRHPNHTHTYVGYPLLEPSRWVGMIASRGICELQRGAESDYPNRPSSKRRAKQICFRWSQHASGLVATTVSYCLCPSRTWA